MRRAARAGLLAGALLVVASELARAGPAPQAIDLRVRGGTLVTLDVVDEAVLGEARALQRQVQESLSR